jgi:citrate lyase subunit beta / citryl-CoA lyase
LEWNVTGKRVSRLRRSELATPASSVKMIKSAAASDADLVFLDLEDAVAPDAKERSRANVVEAFTSLDWGRTTRAYRINGLDTKWCHDDLIEVITGAGDAVDIVIVPKVKAPRDVWFVDDLLTQLELKLGLAVGHIGLELLIEETEALANVEAIAASSPRLEALILGVGDLSASQGIRVSAIEAGGEGGYPGDIWHYARNRLIVAARANGLSAVDGPFAGIANIDGYRRECSWAATLGAAGKWAVHPSQIAVANEVFAPTAAEIEQATSMVEAIRAAEAQGLGSATVNGTMVDAATVRVFEAVLQRARECGLLR